MRLPVLEGMGSRGVPCEGVHDWCPSLCFREALLEAADLLLLQQLLHLALPLQLCLPARLLCQRKLGRQLKPRALERSDGLFRIRQLLLELAEAPFLPRQSRRKAVVASRSGRCNGCKSMLLLHAPVSCNLLLQQGGGALVMRCAAAAAAAAV